MFCLKRIHNRRWLCSSIQKEIMEYRLWVYKLIYHLFQYPSKVVTETADARINIGVTENDDKEILVAITDDNMVAKEFQKHEHCRKNHTRKQVKRFHSRLEFRHRYYWERSYSWRSSCFRYVIWLLSERRKLPEAFEIKLTEKVTIHCYLWQRNKTEQS